jgi:citrate lyase subunit beta/citryl-CoA lyase
MTPAASGCWPRSYLYCPGDRPDRLSRAGTWGADAIIADLEDSVHASRKDVARRSVSAWLAAGWLAQGVPATTERWVRVNPDSLAADLDAVVGGGLRGIVLPKAEPDVAARLDELLTRRERERGLPPGRVVVQAVIETARGLLAAAELARAPRVVRLGVGEADLAAELGADVRADPEVLGPLRLQIVVVSTAARIAAPVGPASTDFRDLAALRTSTEGLLRLGFRGRTAIHPAQLACINDVFSPSADQVARARALISAFDAAADAGVAVITGPDGTMADEAVLRSARDVLARAAWVPAHADPPDKGPDKGPASGTV